MKRILSALLIISSVSLYAQDNTVINDKNAQSRTVSAFHAIKVSNAIDLYLSQGNTEALAVSASEDKYRDRIKTEVDNGVLKIWYDGDGISFSNKKLKAYVSFKDLNSLDASGASDVRINGTLSASTLELKLSGASDIVGNVKISDLKVTANGASDLKLTGAVKSLKINASGASDMKGYDLTADECTATASGASDIHITVNKEISASASGASSVFYKGSAVMKDVHSRGASSVAKKG